MTPNTNTIRLVDANSSSVLQPSVINCYSALANPAYFRAINFIAENLASFPRSVRGQDTAEDFAHPLEKLIRRRPNGYQSPFQLFRTAFFHLAHTGNGYVRIDRDPRTLRPVALHNHDPFDVCPVRYVAEGETSPRQLYLIRSLNAVVAGEDVVHLMGLSWNGVGGLDPVVLHEQTFQRASMIDRYQTRFLAKGSVIRGTVCIPLGVSEEQVEQIQQKIRHFFNGPDAERDVMVLPEGATFGNNTISPGESQLVEQARHSTKQIAQLTGVPPEFLFELGEAKYNASVQQAGETVVRYLFRPMIEMIEDELTLKLLSEDEQDAGLSVRLNPDALIRGDTKTQTDTLIAQRNAGVRTANEVRATLDLPKLDDPEADKLKLLGDTSKPGAATPDASKSA